MKLSSAAVVALALLGASCRQAGQDANASYTADNPATASTGTGAGLDAETAFCKVVEQTVAKEDCDDLEAAREQVRQGAAAFNVPDPMRRGQSVSVQLVIDRRSPELIAELDAEASNAVDHIDEAMAKRWPDSSPATGAEVNSVAGNEAAPAPDAPAHKNPTPRQHAEAMEGRTESFVPPVGRFMSAQLTGQGFKIEPAEARSKEIAKSGQATWVWEVTAMQEGKRSLTLTTVVEAVVNGRRYQLDPTLRVRTVSVEVGWGDWTWEKLQALPDWLKAITGVLVALTALIGAWFGLRKVLRNRNAG